jgi:glycosyltransferase involved in cell wall biosynthesis
VAPLVSIITPSLNRAGLLEQTLRSIANQTYGAVEHIVIDGGSTDGTVNLLRAWEGRYDLRWVSEPDAGMYAAINRGMLLARGEILAYLNSDDLYFPWTIDSVVRRFRDEARADFVYGDVLLWDIESGETQVHWQMPFNLDYIRRSGVLVQPSVFWRREVLDSGGLFDETLRLVADCEYWMRMGARHRFVKMNEFLAVERNHLATLRILGGDAVEAELTNVRSRYVRTRGPHNAIALAWHRLSVAFIRRIYLIRFIRAARSAGSRSAIPWSGLLRSRMFDVSATHAVGALIPVVARLHLPKIARPKAAWLGELSGASESSQRNIEPSAIGSRP